MVMQFSSPDADAPEVAASPPRPPSDPTEEVAVDSPPSSAPASERSGRNTVVMTASVSEN